MDAQTAPTAAWKSRPEREIPTPPTAILFFLITRPESERSGEKKSRFLRFYVVTNRTSLIGHTLNPFNGLIGMVLLEFLTMVQTP